MDTNSRTEFSQSQRQLHRSVRKLRSLFSLATAQPAPLTEDHVSSIVALRRGREAALGRELFCDPAWDILLELYAGELGARSLLVCDVARCIRIPESSTLRWVHMLEARDLVILGASSQTRSRAIRLSAHGKSAMSRIVGYWASAFRSI